MAEEKKGKEAATKPAVVKDEKNGIVRPKDGTKTGDVWKIADDLSSEMQAPAPRKEVLEAAVKSGINPATAATQYGRWRKYNGLEGRGTEADAAPATDPAV